MYLVSEELLFVGVEQSSPKYTQWNWVQESPFSIRYAPICCATIFSLIMISTQRSLISEEMIITIIE